MPIRHFDIFTAERRLIQTSAVTQLKDARLGIDGNYWVRKIVKKENAVAAMGGLPLRLTSSIEKELEGFKQSGITPVFVFAGLPILRKDKPFSTEDTRPGHRATAWDFYYRGKTDLAMSSWASSSGIHSYELLNAVFSILNQHGIEFIRAPYSAWAQLAYMYNHPRQLINYICGGSELLMWDIDKLVTGIDFEKGNYHWVSKRTVLQDLQVSDEQFLDICILAGFEYCPSFPPLSNPSTSSHISFTFNGVHDLIKQHKTGFNAVQAHSDNPIVSKTNYVDLFCRTRCAVKYHLVIHDDGEVRPLNMEHAPNDIHEFIGYRLPDELYYYLMKGLIGPQSISSLVSGVLIESAPLDNGESMEYRQFLIQLLNMRTQTFSLLTQPLHQFYKSRKIASYFWFEPTIERIMHHQPSASPSPSTASPSAKASNVYTPMAASSKAVRASVLNTVYEKTSNWNVKKKFIQSELDQQKATSVDIKFCITTLQNNAKASETITPPQLDEQLEEKNEIVANVLWKMLEIRDFITSSKHIPTPWGHALAAGLSAMNDIPTSLYVQEALLSALELIRFEVLTNKEYSRTYSTPLGDEVQKKHIILLSRTFSLLPMSLKNQVWSGPLNRDLLAFNSFVKALTRSYRNLCEMLALSFFLNGLVVKQRKDYFEMFESLPYMADHNVAMGLACKYYLERIVEGQAPSEALQSTEKAFTTCSNVKGDLKAGFEFWQRLLEAVTLLSNESSIDKSTFDMFKHANEWIEQSRIVNGLK